MKLLFVAYLENDANVHCVQQLQKTLLTQGIQSDLITFRWNPKDPLEEPAACGARYRADTFYRHAQLKRDADGRISMPWHGYLRVALARGFSALLGGIHYKEQGFPFLAGMRLGRTLRTLCSENEYDWVVSVSYPFMMHRLVQHYHPKHVHWAMYQLDPFYHNATYSKQREGQRLRLERNVAAEADAVFYVPEQAPDYERPEFQAFLSKYYPLHYPNFVEPERESRPSPLRTEPGRIDLLYLGTLYAEIRPPDALLALFERMHAQCAALRLHLVGSVFGVGAGETVARYKERLGDALQTYLPMTAEYAKAALNAADVLVNIGNTIQNQMPSKLWEYIATGKPILSVSMTHNCNTLPYLSKYPDRLCVFADELDRNPAAERAVEFCNARADALVSWSQLNAIYPEQLTDFVARGFIKALRNAEARQPDCQSKGENGNAQR